MQAQRNEGTLFELLGRTIKDLQKIEDDPATLNFIARRLGNIVKHMKDLRDDLQPRGNRHNPLPGNGTEDRSPQRIEAFR
ncbi:MAG TPA: hypothetical protein VMH85_10150 [Terriglobales bacterium]|nr:hypothetical protein [Terriglobales bacterium]